jgi:hypothetical protein
MPTPAYHPLPMHPKGLPLGGLCAAFFLSGCASAPNSLAPDEFDRAITVCLAGGQVAEISGTDWECTGAAFWSGAAGS